MTERTSPLKALFAELDTPDDKSKWTEACRLWQSTYKLALSKGTTPAPVEWLRAKQLLLEIFSEISKPSLPAAQLDVSAASISTANDFQGTLTNLLGPAHRQLQEAGASHGLLESAAGMDADGLALALELLQCAQEQGAAVLDTPALQEAVASAGLLAAIQCLCQAIPEQPVQAVSDLLAEPVPAAADSAIGSARGSAGQSSEGEASLFGGMFSEAADDTAGSPARPEAPSNRPPNAALTPQEAWQQVWAVSSRLGDMLHKEHAAAIKSGGTSAAPTQWQQAAHVHLLPLAAMLSTLQPASGRALLLTLHNATVSGAAAEALTLDLWWHFLRQAAGCKDSSASALAWTLHPHRMALLLLASHSLTSDCRSTLVHAALQLVYLLSTTDVSADILNPACFTEFSVPGYYTSQQLLQRQSQVQESLQGQPAQQSTLQKWADSLHQPSPSERHAGSPSEAEASRLLACAPSPGPASPYHVPAPTAQPPTAEPQQLLADANCWQAARQQLSIPSNAPLPDSAIAQALQLAEDLMALPGIAHDVAQQYAHLMRHPSPGNWQLEAGVVSHQQQQQQDSSPAACGLQAMWAAAWLASQAGAANAAVLEAAVTRFQSLRFALPADQAAHAQQLKAMISGWCTCFLLADSMQRTRLLGFAHWLAQGAPGPLLEVMHEHLHSPLWAPATCDCSHLPAPPSPTSALTVPPAAQGVLDLLSSLLCNPWPAAGLSQPHDAPPGAAEGSLAQGPDQADSQGSSQQAQQQLQGLQVLIQSTLDLAFVPGKLQEAAPAALEQTMMLITRAAVHLGLPGVCLLLKLLPAISDHLSGSKGASVEQAVVFLPVIRFIQAILENRAYGELSQAATSNSQEPSSRSTQEAAPASVNPAAAGGIVPLELAVQGSGVGIHATDDSGPVYEIVGDEDLDEGHDDGEGEEDDDEEGDDDDDEDDDDEEDDDGEDDGQYAGEDIVAPAGEPMDLDLNAEAAELVAEEVLLLDGQDEDGELFDFGEAGLAGVTAIPEELLSAVAELTGDDPNTLRQVTHLAGLRQLHRGRIAGGRGHAASSTDPAAAGRGAIRYVEAASAPRGVNTSGGLADATGSDGLAVCSYVRSGQQFVEQHWYYCYTCGLHDSKGCCSVCAAVCHVGHDLVYSGRSRFFCDCGAGVPGCPPCRCLTPASLPAPAQSQHAGHTPASVDDGQEAVSTALQLATGSALGTCEADVVQACCTALRTATAADATVQEALHEAASALGSIAERCVALLKADAAAAYQNSAAGSSTEPQEEGMSNPHLAESLCAVKLTGFGPTRQLRSGSTGTTAASSAPETPPVRELRGAEEAGLVLRSAMAASAPLGLLAFACGSFVGILDLHLFAADATDGAPTVPESSSAAPDVSAAVVARHPVKFQVAFIAVDSLAGSHLAVAGLHDLQVWTLESNGKLSDRLAVTVPTDHLQPTSEPFISQVQWLPQQDTWLAVTSLSRVFLYDLSQDARQPLLTLTTPDAAGLCGCTFALSLAPLSYEGVQLQSPVLTCVLLTREAALASTVLPPLPSIAHPSKPAGNGTDCILAAPDLQSLSSLLGGKQAAIDHRGISIRHLPGSGLLAVCTGTAEGQELSNTQVYLGRLSEDGASVVELQAATEGSSSSSGSGSAALPDSLHLLEEVPLLSAARHAAAGRSILVGTCGALEVNPCLLAVHSHDSPAGNIPAISAVQALLLQTAAGARGSPPLCRVGGVACMPLPAEHCTLVALLTSTSLLCVCCCPGSASASSAGGPPITQLSDLHMPHETQQGSEDDESGSDAEQPEVIAYGSADWCARVMGPRYWGIGPPLLEPGEAPAELRTHMAPHWPSQSLPARSPLAAAVLNLSPGAHASGSASGDGSLASSQGRAMASDTFPLEFFESCSPIMLGVQLSGDFTHAGGPDTVRASLLTHGGFLQAPSTAAYTFSLSSHNSDLIIVGVKVMVGVSGLGHMPVSVRLGPKEVRLPAGQSRWHAIKLSPEQALADRSRISLELGRAQDASRVARLDALEVYAKPRTDLAIDLMEAEMAGENATPKGPPGDGPRLAESAVGMPGRSFMLEPPILAGEALLSHALQALLALHALAPQAATLAGRGQGHVAGRQAAMAVVSLHSQELSQWLPSSFLHGAAWALLLRSPGTPPVVDEHNAAVYAERDTLVLSQVQGALSTPAQGSMWSLVAGLSQVLEIFLKRPGNLQACVRSADSTLPASMAGAAHTVLHALQQQSGQAELPHGFLRLYCCALVALLHLQCCMQAPPTSDPVSSAEEASLSQAGQDEATNAEATSCLTGLLLSGQVAHRGCMHAILTLISGHCAQPQHHSRWVSCLLAQGSDSAQEARLLMLGHLVEKSQPPGESHKMSSTNESAAGGDAPSTPTQQGAALLLLSHMPKATADVDDGPWRGTLCRAMALPALSDSKRLARKVLLTAIGSHTKYRDLRSMQELTACFKDAKEAARAAAAAPVHYQAATQLTGAIKRLHKAVDSRPKADRALKAQHVSWLFSIPAQSPGQPASTPTAGIGASVMSHVVGRLALGSPSDKVRAEACKALEALCKFLPGEGSSNGGALPSRGMLLQHLLAWLPHMAPYGLAAGEMFGLLTTLVQLPHHKSKRTSVPGDGDKPPRPKAADKAKEQSGHLPVSGEHLAAVLGSLKQQNSVLADHPHAEAYHSLQGVLTAHGHYLDVEASALAESPESGKFTIARLDGLQAETKFSHNAIMTRLKQPSLINGFQVGINDPDSIRMVRRMTFYYYPWPLTELTPLKNDRSLWLQALTVDLKPGQRAVRQSLGTPVLASALMVQYSAVWQNLSEAAAEVLHCPRCSHTVVDAHGVCRYCRENALQCRQCRNINYEHLDAFVCNECGHSRFARFEFSVSAAPAFFYPPLRSSQDRTVALAALTAASEAAFQKQVALADLERPLQEALTSAAQPSSFLSVQSTSGDSVPGVKKALQSVTKMYQDLLRTNHAAALDAHQSTMGIRSALTQQAAPGSDQNAADDLPITVLNGLGSVKLPQSSDSYRAAEFFVSRTATRQLLGRLVQQGGSSARQQLTALIRQRVMYTVAQHRALRVAECLSEEVALLKELCLGNPAPDAWQEQLRLVFELLLHASAVAPGNPAIAEHVVLPCLTILEANLGGASPTAAATGSSALRQSSTAQAAIPGSPARPRGDSTDVLEEDVGPVVSFQEFQGAQGGLATYLLWRTRASGFSGKGGLSRGMRLCLRFARRWRLLCLRRQAERARATKQSSEGQGSPRGGALDVVPMSKLLSTLLLSCTSPKARKLAVKLLKRLCLPSPHITFRLLHQLITLLPEAAAAGSAAIDYLALVQELAEAPAAASHLAAQGVMRDYYMLRRLSALMEAMASAPGAAGRRERAAALPALVFLVNGLQSLAVGQTKLTGEACKVLGYMLRQQWPESSFSARRSITEAAMKVLSVLYAPGPASSAALGRIPALVIDKACAAIRPPPVEKHYLLQLDKSPTQDVYVRGHMTQNPYSSQQVGPLMRDVKNHICRQLDLTGIIDDDFGMELLVLGNLVSLNLPVRLVYESLWQPSHQQRRDTTTPPMRVIFRLQGLDGEATEPMVSSLPDPQAMETDPEEEYQVAAVLASRQLASQPRHQQQQQSQGSLVMLTHRLEAVTGGRQSGSLGDEGTREASQLIRLLNHAAQLQVNRRELLDSNALSKLLPLCLTGLRQLLQLGQPQVPQPSVQQQGCRHVHMAEADLLVLLDVLELLAADAGDTSLPVRGQAPVLDVRPLAEALKAAEAQGRANVSSAVARVLPHLAHSSPAAQAALLDHFVLSLDLAALDATPSNSEVQDQERDLQSFLRLVESVDASQHATSIDFRTLLLSALVHGHQAIADCLAGVPSLLPLLHQIEEHCPSSLEAGPLAAAVLEDIAACGGPHAAAAIAELRAGTRARKQALAARRRASVLASMNLSPSPGPSGSREMWTAAAPQGSELAAALEAAAEAGEQGGAVCMVCKEGPSSSSQSLMAAYVYCSRQPAMRCMPCTPPGTTSTAQVQGVVSHWNLIHVSCHEAARKADSSLRVAKREWEGATLRNGGTLTNALLPVRTGEVPEGRYTVAVASFMEALACAGGSSSSSRRRGSSAVADTSSLVQVATCIAQLLQAYAHGQSFSSEAKGGGPESNMRLLLALVALGRYFAGCSSPEDIQAAKYRGVRGLVGVWGLVAQLQSQLKGGGAAEWENSVTLRLEDFTRVDDLAKEGLALLEELQEADSAQEAFDIMGMLATVLASHTTCEQYLGWS
ncbi:hypothetical protein WJX73_001476 [Symbiochloris irregularis]|uniref:UBR-type domain-containing protein n=1 Tax=Symbiochloris irregularis TaxID=706552 RepID=A0AAW1PQP5_9CHLO